MTKAATPSSPEPAAYLDMPSERRDAAKAHAALLGATMRKLSAEISFQADIEDFSRVLHTEGK
jgi:hypothetical protein